MPLKIDYVNQIPSTPTKIHNILDSADNPLFEEVKIIDETVYTQEGDSFGATDINATNTQVNANTQSISDIGTILGDVTVAQLEWLSDLKPLKNWIINGMFDVWQRGTSQTSDGYGSDDRWYNSSGNVTKTNSRQKFTLGQTDVPNNPTYFSRTVLESPSGAWAYKQQRIEDVSKLAGKEITVSFWAKVDSNKNISLELTQFFGSGGSTAVNEIGVQKFAITTEWQKYTKTLIIPDIIGKTVNDKNHIGLNFWFCADSSLNSRTDSLGQQSGTFDIANVSLVDGNVAVECQNQPYADVLRECQRYYVIFNALNAYTRYGMGESATATVASIIINFPNTMITVPTSIDYSGAFAIQTTGATLSVSSIVLVITGSSKNVGFIDCNTSGLTAGRVALLVSNNNTTSYIGFNAEL